MRSLLRKYTLPGLIICLLGLAALGLAYILWLGDTRHGLLPCLAAALSAALFALICLRFVPGWMRFWSGGKYRAPAPSLAEPARIRTSIFIWLLVYCLLLQIFIYVLFAALGRGRGLAEYLEFWKCLDSGHYVDIARDWYLSEGSRDRVVQLVFLPGYPLAMRLMHFFVRDWVLSGLLVSILSFSAAGSVIYSLLRLDYGHEESLRAVRYLCLLPGSFFFVAPMSESLFLLLSAGCVYLVRRGKIGAGCLLGAYAAFTRSLGLMLFVPACMELVHEAVDAPRGRRRPARFLCLLLIPAGFGAYLAVNYQVSGNPFQYMIYQSEHWGQNLGLFFNTAAYQLEGLLSSLGSNAPYAYGLWLPNLVFDFAALAVMIPAARDMRPSYTAWFIAYYFVAIGATWLLSSPRYMVSLLSFFLALSSLARTRTRDAALSTALIILNILYAIAFVMRWQVW